MNRQLIGALEAEYRRYKALAEGAFDQVGPEEIGRDPGGGANSIATIVWHVSGNLRSRFTDFLTSDGEKPWRDRDSEFEPRSPTAAELRAEWESGWSVLLAALAELTDADLASAVTIRGVRLGVDEALLRSLAHTSYHVGQIVHLAKTMRGEGWRSLSIPRGGSADYGAAPTSERAADHAAHLAEGTTRRTAAAEGG